MSAPRKRRRIRRPVRDLADQDYGDRLSPDQQEWLARFNDEFYQASFDSNPIHTDPAQRRALGVDNNMRNEDMYGRGLRVGGEGFGDGAVAAEQDWTVPDYQARPTYREALMAFRSKIPSDRRKNTVVDEDFVALSDKLALETGAKTRLGISQGGLVAKSRVEKLLATREVIFNLGVIVAQHQFKGSEAEVAVNALAWISAFYEKLEGKLKGMGVELKPLGQDKQ